MFRPLISYQLLVLVAMLATSGIFAQTCGSALKTTGSRAAGAPGYFIKTNSEGYFWTAAGTRIEMIVKTSNRILDGYERGKPRKRTVVEMKHNVVFDGDVASVEVHGYTSPYYNWYSVTKGVKLFSPTKIEHVEPGKNRRTYEAYVTKPAISELDGQQRYVIQIQMTTSRSGTSDGVLKIFAFNESGRRILDAKWSGGGIEPSLKALLEIKEGQLVAELAERQWP